jgi:tripartite ATP-independent transporter DctM subunit
MILAVVASFFVLASLGMPLSFALGIASLAGVLAGGAPLIQLPGKLVHSIDSFPLMAIPLFTLGGELMIRAGIMERMFEFANALVGRIRGGLAHVTVVAEMVVSTMTGTAVGDAAALAGMLGPTLTRAYGREFAASVVAAAATLGPIIPPSAGVIVYAVMAGDVSVAALFLAGFLPGIVLGLAMMALCTWFARRRGYPLAGEPFSLRKLWRETRRSFVVLMMPVVVIGGIIVGAFTATEGAAISVVYALVVGFFVTGQLRLADLPRALLNAAVITAVVGALIGFASMVTYLLTAELVPQRITEALQSVTSSSFLFVLLVMLLLVVVGMFLESNAAYIMLVPLLAPVAVTYGLDPVYFGFLFIMNITLGSITPPVGILLFVVSALWELPLARLVANIWPFILITYAGLFLCMLFPPIITFLPKLFGY